MLCREKGGMPEMIQTLTPASDDFRLLFDKVLKTLPKPNQRTPVVSGKEKQNTEQRSGQKAGMMSWFRKNKPLR
jgi:hypothetical protein